MASHHRLIAVLALLVTLGGATSTTAAAGHVVSPSSVAATGGTASPEWLWPVGDARSVTAPYRAPAHAYGSGHRGVDLGPAPGGGVRAPADGVVAFRGVVVDRAVLTIQHADGYVSSYEPLESELSVGDAVRAGDPIGTVATGGHAAAGALHFGVRRDGVYINPLLMLGGVPRAVLLPCCAGP